MTRFLLWLISGAIASLNAAARALSGLHKRVEGEIGQNEAHLLLLLHAPGYMDFIGWDNSVVARETISGYHTRTEVLALCAKLEATIQQLPAASIPIPAPKIRVLGMAEELAAEIDNWIGAHNRMLDERPDPAAEEMFSEFKEMIRKGPWRLR